MRDVSPWMGYRNWWAGHPTKMHAVTDEIKAVFHVSFAGEIKGVGIQKLTQRMRELYL